MRCCKRGGDRPCVSCKNGTLGKRTSGKWNRRIRESEENGMDGKRNGRKMGHVKNRNVWKMELVENGTNRK